MLRHLFTFMLALSLGGRLVAHDCPAHHIAASAPAVTPDPGTTEPAEVDHAAMGHGAVGHAGHSAASVATTGEKDERAPACTCGGDCLCAARESVLPAQGAVVDATFADVPQDRPAIAPVARTDHGVRLLPFANGPPVTRAILA